MILRANTANALRYNSSIPGVSASHHKFQTTEKITRTTGFLYRTVIDNGFDLEMAFDSGYRVNYYFSTHYSLYLPFFEPVSAYFG